MSTPPARLRRATSPYTGEAFSAAFDGNPQAPAPKRTRDARPYGGDGWPGGNVGADAFIGPCREAASRGGCNGCGRPFVPPHQRPPCVKGPQGSAACGRTSDRSGWAAACLGGPQRGPGRLSGNPELSAARLTGGLSTPPTRLRRATSPYTGEAFSAAFDGNPQAPAPKRTRDARPYGGDGWPGGNVGADAFIGPCRFSGLSWRVRWYDMAVCTAPQGSPGRGGFRLVRSATSPLSQLQRGLDVAAEDLHDRRQHLILFPDQHGAGLHGRREG